ncbi:MAG: NAD(+) synthase [Cryomorphaceae bacterium]|jgi:NAD+ synthase|nr:NAD(+) synthase [Cryomorphaceae bacterium]MDG1889183.1 NAD(+) synthase [Flavobacteriaceae bacterium]MBT3503307.1 NAD(+) synthase [Cryomorphaceae bacterium]MBT3689671.1 NAD(+) synthase [Cryomorphaceae bacterium]MBT4221770.1 NAD(+) synthase [Cryomorphaceae bacterium]|tara:strand:+ start:1895 stop:2680 length:786 start_codon:yes stop_codon:yes gene_type:complete
MKYPEKVSKHIVSWLDEYLNRSGMKGIVVGVSGGIDSALTSTLCAETGRDIICIEMPIHQGKDQVSRSKNHIEWLKEKYPNVSSMLINLDNTFDSFVDSIPKIKSPENELSLANTRSRLRMVTLYYFSALNKYIVAGTGNKVEDFGIGFYTKYGDGGVDISPIADLLKSEVYSLAEFFCISNEIIKAKPTDGLWNDNRNDEDQIGASYNELERSMQIADRLDQDLSDREKEVLKIYKSLNSSNRHKMLPIPVCKIPKDYLR